MNRDERKSVYRRPDTRMRGREKMFAGSVSGNRTVESSWKNSMTGNRERRLTNGDPESVMLWGEEGW